MNRQTLQLLVQPQAHNSFWISNILTSIGAFAAKLGDAVSFPSPEQLEANGSATPVLVIGNNLDWLELNVERLLNRGVHPIVVNACSLPGYQNRCSSVVFAVEDAVLELRQHLRSVGKTRPVLLGVNRLSAADRIKCEAFASPDNVICADGPIEDCTREFAEHLDTLGYDCALCVNDTAAICLCRALTERGYSIPRDFAVTGMGNSYLGAALPLPLTSVDFDYPQLGRQAVRLFHSIISNPEPCHENRALPCRLIIRASTGSPPTVSRRSPVVPLTPDSTEGTLYFTGTEGQHIISLEAVLQTCRSTDREILFALMRGESCEQIAQELFFTPRAVRYRISKLSARFGLSSRAELSDFLRRAAGLEHTSADCNEKGCDPL